ncbi:MAG: hypothetical protein KDD35_02260 [Bdellovibrionales bacterium]|nr:hypothetical protein [Bdellovibrionales bacterium]
MKILVVILSCVIAMVGFGGATFASEQPKCIDYVIKLADAAFNFGQDDDAFKAKFSSKFSQAGSYTLLVYSFQNNLIATINATLDKGLENDGTCLLQNLAVSLQPGVQ